MFTRRIRRPPAPGALRFTSVRVKLSAMLASLRGGGGRPPPSRRVYLTSRNERVQRLADPVGLLVLELEATLGQPLVLATIDVVVLDVLSVFRVTTSEVA